MESVAKDRKTVFHGHSDKSRATRGRMSPQYLINMYVNDDEEDTGKEIHNNWKRECHESVSDAATKSQPQECLSPRQSSLQVYVWLPHGMHTGALCLCK